VIWTDGTAGAVARVSGDSLDAASPIISTART